LPAWHPSRTAQVFLRFAKNQIDEEAHETPDLHQQLAKQASWAHNTA
jgi:hypothetical protein